MSGYLGETLALLSAVSFALFNVSVGAMPKTQRDKGVLFSVVVTIMFSALLFGVLEAGRVPIDMSGQGAPGIAYFAFAGLAAMVFGRSLVFASIQRLGAIRSSAVKRLNPFFSVLLAAVFLSEAISGSDALGLTAIAGAFAILVRDSFRNAGGAVSGTPNPVAYTFGVGASLAYAIAYIARKAGLEHLDAPAFGTLISAVAGLVGFGVLAIFLRRYRDDFRGLFIGIDRRIVAAAVLVSAGQILMFAALAHESVATVVMISSLEIFFSIFLSAFVLRSEPRPNAAVLVSAGLAMAGVILVAAA